MWVLLTAVGDTKEAPDHKTWRFRVRSGVCPWGLSTGLSYVSHVFSCSYIVVTKHFWLKVNQTSYCAFSQNVEHRISYLSAPTVSIGEAKGKRAVCMHDEGDVFGYNANNHKSKTALPLCWWLCL